MSLNRPTCIRIRTRTRTGLHSLAVATLLACGGAAQAASVSWLGSSSFWDIASNWTSFPALPGAGDDVTIDVCCAQTVTYRTAGATTVNSLSMPGSDNLAINGTNAASLTVTGAFSNNATTSIQGSTLVLNGRSTMKNATLAGTWGTLSGSGTVEVVQGGVFTWSGGTQGGAGRTTIDAGAALNIGGGTLTQRTLDNQGSTLVTGTFTNGGTVNNAVGATITFQDAGTTYWQGTGSYQNAGTLQKTGTGTSVVNGPVNNTGTVIARSGVLQLAGGGAMAGGLYTTAGSGTLQLSGGTQTVDTHATLSGSGVRMTGGTVSGAGTLEVAPGSVFTWSGGTHGGSGRTTVDAGATLNISGGVGLAQRTLDNHGNLVITGTLTNGGAVVNAAGATLSFQGAGSTYWQGTGSYSNAGLFVKAGTGTTTLYGAATNTGTFSVQAGNLNLSQAFANNGTVSVAAGSVFQVSGATFSNLGTITGDGTVAAPASGLVNQGHIDPGTTVGHLGITGNLQQAASGVIDIDLAGPQHADLLSVTGNAALGGHLVVRDAGYVPVLGDSFTVMTFAGRSGSTFSGAIGIEGFDPSVHFAVLYEATDLRLVVTSVPEPATGAMLLGGVALLGWRCSGRPGVQRRKRQPAH